MIIPVFENFRNSAIQNQLVNMVSVGDIQLFENKKTIKYPFVNFDIVSTQTKNFIKTYRIRCYVCDRNENPYLAYNKCEYIIDQLMNEYQISNYDVKYFTLEHKDVVDGIFVDFDFEAPMNIDCINTSVDIYDISKLTITNVSILENGDIIKE